MPTKKKTRRPNIKQLLDRVVKILNTDAPNNSNEREDARAFWNILTALRGPDTDNDVIKHRTTCRIRGVIGMVPGNAAGAVVRTTPQVSTEAEREDRNYHFNAHYRYAVDAVARIYGYDLYTEKPVKFQKSQDKA